MNHCLHCACASNDLKNVKFFIEEKGVDVNHVTEGGNDTPLMRALFKGASIQVIQYLLDKGASVTMTGQSDWTVLHFASYGYTGKAKIHMIRLLVDAGANVHMKTTSDRTILHMAAHNNHRLLVKYLLEHTSIDIHAKDSYRDAALEDTTDEEVMRLLLQHGANPFHVHLPDVPFWHKAKETFLLRACIRDFLALKRFPRLGIHSPLHMLPTDLIRLLFHFLVSDRYV